MHSTLQEIEKLRSENENLKEQCRAAEEKVTSPLSQTEIEEALQSHQRAQLGRESLAGKRDTS